MKLDARSGKYGLQSILLAYLYPYHYTPVQVIEEGDPARRMDFCRFMLNADMEDPTFLNESCGQTSKNFTKTV